MQKVSLWSESSTELNFPELEGIHEVPVAIIGGGMAGILTSYLLTEAGIHNIVLEAGKIGKGTTSNTTAKITAGHNLVYNGIATSYGEGFALKYAQSNLDAIKQFKEIVDHLNIDCDFKTEDNYVYAMTNNDADKLDDEYKTLKKIGIPCNIEMKTDLPFQVLSALKMPDQASFHPLNFLYSIAENLNIYENSRVISVDTDSNILQTPKGAVHAQKIVVCSHFPFMNTPGYFFLKMFQERSYLMAIQNPINMSGMYIDCNEKGHTFRTYKDLLLIGGNGHRCGHNETGNIYQSLEAYIHKLFPKSKVLYKWSAQDCIPLDNIPYIGYFSKKTPDIFVATGFKKWGMTSSMVAANIIRDLIMKKKNDYEELYSPSRFEILSSAKNILDNAADTVKGLTFEHITSDNPNCPHLGCKLTWNPDEQSWDCPCHGSRFDQEGEILNNPSQEKLITKTT